MGYLSLNWIIEQEKLCKVCVEVLDYNRASRTFFLLLGFVEKGHLRKYILKNDRCVDVIQHGLFADEWRNNHRTTVQKLLQKSR